ncbi:hypothetical protein BRADI_3g31985v3 [Brachypodium distachyon]|uniref:Uncharacterized protein n=1 Tax=Brachypodium distachyon TaxID=15368 RepID=A0A2K2D0G5_BRADI|nr:hypothetical protein BRADI_3g31985v3 [Brachypodium distachyon]
MQICTTTGCCFHCDYKGAKIIHPSSETYFGHCNFEDMARGQNRMNNKEPIEYRQLRTPIDGTLQDDDLYV